MNSFMLLSSAAFGLPVVQAKTSSPDSAVGTNDAPRKIKVSSIPLYPEPEKYTFTAKPACRLESFVKDTRIQATSVKQEYQPVIDKIMHVVETGKAHTNEALWYLRDEKNLGSQIGAMAVGGILGLIAARKRGFIRKLTNMFVGVGAVGAVCYPEQARIVAGDTGKFALKNARIAYNFVVGARPTVQNENGKPFDRMMGMTSDISKWGFNLFENKEKPAPAQEPVQEEIVPSLDLKTETEADVYVPQSSVQEVVQVLSSESVAETSPVDSSVNSAEEESSPEVVLVSGETLDDAPIENSSSVDSANPEAMSTTKDEDKVITENSDGSLGTATEEVPEKEASNTPTAVIYEEDLGQGTLEDKELYTTRE